MKFLRSILLTLMVLALTLAVFFVLKWNFIILENNRAAVEKETTLASRGVTTSAEIISYKQIYRNDRRPSTDQDGTLRYTIEYRFDAGGKTYYGTTYIGKTAPFDRVEIVYDPDFPENNASPLQTRTLEMSIGAIVSLNGIIFIFVAGICRWGWRVVLD